MNHLGAYEGQELVTWFGRGVPVRVQTITRTHVDLRDTEYSTLYRFRWKDQLRLARLHLVPATPHDRNPFGVVERVPERLALLAAFSLDDLQAVVRMGTAAQASVRAAAEARIAALAHPSTHPTEVPVHTDTDTDTDTDVALTTPRGPELLSLSLEALTLDPSLQCRQGGVDPDVVAEYATAIREGATFPPVTVVRVAGDVPLLLVVDGWHRHAAHVQAQRKMIDVHVVDGTRREALLRAVAANASHGKQRTMEDKRRAVRMLLMDAEWAGLSSRELARLAGVSHTFVDESRRRYGVGRGEVVSDARATHVDGDLPEAWRAILHDLPSWKAHEVEQARLAPDPVALLRVHPYHDSGKAAVALRRQELAVEPWPWPEDATAEEVRWRCGSLDSKADLVQALTARGPDGAPLAPELQDELYGVLERVEALLGNGYVDLARARLALASRPGLLELVAARTLRDQEEDAKRQEREAKAGETDPYRVVQRIHQAPNAIDQAALLRTAPEAARKLVSTQKLFPEVRDGAYRDIVDRLHTAPRCPDPACQGWCEPMQYGAPQCTICRGTVANTERRMRRDLAGAGSLLGHAGYGFRVHTAHGPADITDDVADLVAQLQAAAAEGGVAWTRWLGTAPVGIRQEMYRVLESEFEGKLFVDHKVKADLEPEADRPASEGEGAEGEEVADA